MDNTNSQNPNPPNAPSTGVTPPTLDPTSTNTVPVAADPLSVLGAPTTPQPTVSAPNPWSSLAEPALPPTNPTDLTGGLPATPEGFLVPGPSPSNPASFMPPVQDPLANASLTPEPYTPAAPDSFTNPLQPASPDPSPSFNSSTEDFNLPSQTSPPASPIGLDNAISSWQSNNPSAAVEPLAASAAPAIEPSLPNPNDTLLPQAQPTPPDQNSFGTYSTNPVYQPVAPTEIQAPTISAVPSPATIDTPAQTPPQPIPTWPPVSGSVPVETPPSNPDPLASANQMQATLGMAEPAPTDLSQLTGTAPPPPPPAENYSPAPATIDVQPSVATPTEPAQPETTGKQQFPVKLLIGGIIALLLVTAASVYIFFFAGSNTPSASLPAETQVPLTEQPPQALNPTPPASGSATPENAGFGALNGSSPSARPTSALESLRQRQQQQQQ